jgi:hypothetical protein
MEENVPLALSDVVFDFVTIEVKKTDAGCQAEMVVAACVKKEVGKFTEALRQAGLEPVGCLHESQAIARSVLKEGYKGTVCVIHARQNRIGIYLVKDGLVCFSTLTPVLGNDYTNPLLDEYGKFLDYHLKLDPDRTDPIKSIFVCGEFEYVKKTVESLAESASQPKDIKLANVWANVFEVDRYAPEMPYEESLSFAGPIGAVLSDIT